MGSESKISVFRAGRCISNMVHSLIFNMIVMKFLSFFVFFLGLTFGLFGFSIYAPLSFLIVFMIYQVTGGYKFTKVFIKTFPRDARGLFNLIRVKINMKRYLSKNYTIPDIFRETVLRHPDKACFIFEGKSWTFRQVDEYSNKIGNYFHDQGFQQGDVIALFAMSRPEYCCVWLGLSKIGVVPALINFNLRLESLGHCIQAAEAKAVIYGGEMSEAIKEISPFLSRDLPVFCLGDYNASKMTARHIDPALDECVSSWPPVNLTTKFTGKLFYIFTSGTTGLPKAAVVVHSRFYYMAFMLRLMFRITVDDVIYDTLPLYHTAGGILGMGQALLGGSTVVIRSKFSASRFWEDCVQYNCTVVQYIGELCRYLLAQPYRPSEHQHKVRVAFGNGLRPQIWKQFVQRFGINVIGEFYGATEGNANIINPDSTVGAVGFCSRIAPFLYPVTLIKVDEDTGEPIRDRYGLCVKCQPGEHGELVGKIVKGDPIRSFDGYVNTKASQKKIATDVFSRGDTAFLTGDILEMDEYGYMYFKDRTGDTFRWRGENVSTAEVEAVISNCLKLKDAVIYGVEVPGSEGRAGMAAIADNEKNVDLAALHRDLKRGLPAYARPLFIRFTQLESTGTFKFKKTELKKDGFNINVTQDHIYYLEAKADKYSILDKQVYKEISLGKIKF